jgi:MFS transporter, NNP family, nitrate/nitrite transporter
MTTSSFKADLNLALATLSFAICFAAWGLMSALAPYFRDLLHLDATQTALLVVVPVLLGSLARIPIGMLADRIGGRAIFTVLMVVVAVPTAFVATAESYRTLLLVAFFLGLAGSSFAVGVGFVSRRYAPERQGTAVGIY